MANRKKVLIIIAAALLLLAVFYFAKGNMESQNNGLPKNTEATHDVFGVIALEKAVQAHPQYEKLEQLKKERRQIASSIENAPPTRLDMTMPELDMAAVDDSIRQKKMEKVRQKLDELNERLKQQELSLREAHAPAYGQAAKEIDAQYLPKIFNLQLKLETLSISQEAGREIKRQVDGLKMEHEQKLSEARQEIFAKIAASMTEEQEKAKKELDAYAAAVEQELVADARKQLDETQARNHLAMAGKSSGISLGAQPPGKTKEDLENKEKEIAVLQEAILKDIAAKVAKIAKDNQLSVVLTSVQVNVTAMDITDLVIKEFNK